MNKHGIKENGAFLDLLGISASAVCAVHCLLLPVLLPVLLSMGLGIFSSEWFENVMIWSAVGIALFTASHGFLKKHGKVYPYIFLAVAVAVLLNKEILGERYEPLAVLTGAIFIVITNALNWRLCKSCPHCK
jgi:hypothetical protein